MAKRGRPRKSPDEKAVAVTIPKWAIDMLDASFRDHDDDIHKLRREAIANLIQGKHSFEALHPDRIEIIAPVAGNKHHLKEAADWMEAEERRLAAEAPAAIQGAIESNRWFLLMAGKNSIRKVEQREDKT